MSPTSGLFFLLPLTLCLALHPHLTTATPKNATTATTPKNATTTTTTPKNATTTTTPKNATTSLIEKACSMSQRKAFCLSVLKSEPNSKNADLKGLAFIALKAASKNATTILVKIQTWLNDTEAEPALDDALSGCDDSYLDVVDQIGDSINALVSGANGNVETWMKAAVADIDTCDAGVKGLTTAHAVELTQENRVLRQLCNVALGIVHVLSRD